MNYKYNPFDYDTNNQNYMFIHIFCGNERSPLSAFKRIAKNEDAMKTFYKSQILRWDHEKNK